MGKKLIIPGADFSAVAVDIDDTLYHVTLSQGAVNLIYGGANFGDFTYSPASNRLHAPATTPIFIANGQSVFFTGLRSLDNTKGLLIDGVQYSQATASNSYAEHSLNGDSASTFFTLNANKDDEYTWTNNLGDGYFIFCFADGPVSSTAADVSPSEFDLMCSVDLG